MASSHGAAQPRFISSFINKAASLSLALCERGEEEEKGRGGGGGEGGERALLSSGFQSSESLLILDPLSLSSLFLLSLLRLSFADPLLNLSVFPSLRALALPPLEVPDEIIHSIV